MGIKKNQKSKKMKKINKKSKSQEKVKDTKDVSGNNQPLENYYVNHDKFKWHVKGRFLLTELIGAGVGAWFAVLLVAFFAGFNAEQSHIIVFKHSWWIVLSATAFALPTNEILFHPIQKFLKFYKKNRFSEIVLTKAYVRAHNIPFRHGVFMFLRFCIGAGSTTYVATHPELLPGPISYFQIINCILYIVFAVFVSGVIAYLSAERVFTRFINDLNFSVWKISRKLILHKKISRISIRQRMMILLVPLIVLTVVILGMYTFQEISSIIHGGMHTLGEDYLSGLTKRIVFLLSSSTLFAVFTIYFSSTNTVRPLNYAIETLKHVSKGDLTQRLVIDSQDEIRNVLYEIITTLKNLENVIRLLSNSINKTNDLSRFLNVISESIGEGARIQKQTLEKSVQNVNELSASANVVMGSGEETSAFVTQVFNSLESFVESITQIGDMINAVREEGKKLSDRVKTGEDKLNLMVRDMEKIKQSSDQIRKATALINEIADQTNLLALNASIEAARAGEHGKGFAVVADEVSKLAERSTQEVNQIEKMVIETGANIDEGVKSVNEIKELLTFFTYNVYHIVSKIDKISEERDRQAIGSEEIRTSVVNLNKMAQNIYEQSKVQVERTASMKENINETETLTKDYSRNSIELQNLSNSLNNISKELSNLISSFKLIDKKGEVKEKE